ncbi:hypothetical protein BDV96DRAFT_113146 [Lophiotrema nucula]|uniref:WD-like domain-containing protein n=1 Tax=Lophiotrema nucula TaxID=690887 RepID=A0A6A5Z245_9PLEO|nr:hypothetical protein BDV96DRAFT_113146 [Lophiotrema nucula]
MLGISTMATLIASSTANQSDYIEKLSTLSEGTVTQGNSSGIVWLNVTGFAPEKLPYIQQDLGIFTYDNLEGLKTTASLAATAASNFHYGDLVYFFNAFAMNAFNPYIDISSEEMEQALLAAVRPANSSLPDHILIDLYADTSSISSLREAFLALKSLTVTLEDPNTPTTSIHGNQK